MAAALLLRSGSRLEAYREAENDPMVDGRVRDLLKSAAAVGVTNDGDYGVVLADWKTASGAFFESLKSESLFFRLLAGGLRKVPLGERLGAVSVGATGSIIPEY